MKDFSVSMALVDFIPVILFAIAAVILMRDLYNKMGKGAYALFSCGLICIISAGALKATYKLLYAAGVCDFEALNHMFFPTQSIGFLLAGIGALLMLCRGVKGHAAFVMAPPIFKGTFVFVGMMVTGLGLLDAVLCILSVKMKKPALIALFALSFVCSLGMGYLSTKDFAEASMNWIAEGVNVLGQGALLSGVLLLHRGGLGSLSLAKETAA